MRLLLSLLLPFALCAAETRRPNILWLVAENIGPDLGCYGYPVVKTPNLDRFAQEGMRYRLAFSTSPFCSPSRSAILTGMYQTSIGAHHHRSHFIEGLDADFTLPTGVRPFTQLLRDGDLPGVPVNRTTALSWLPNGNIVFSNYPDRAPQTKLVEITRNKKVVWTYTDATNQGAREFQLLDEAGKSLTGVLH